MYEFGIWVRVSYTDLVAVHSVIYGVQNRMSFSSKSSAQALPNVTTVGVVMLLRSKGHVPPDMV